MTQTQADKIAAIRSVLFLLEDHLRLIESVGSSLRGISPTSPTMPCEHDDEYWLVYQRNIRRRYRLGAVERALHRLEEHDSAQAQAVIACYVCIPPIDWWEPHRAEGLAEEGLAFMADCIPGPMPTYVPWHDRADRAAGERLTPVEREAEVLRLRMSGHSFASIARKVRCSKSVVRDICHAHIGRQRRTTDAGS